jgi:hypothetical protein
VVATVEESVLKTEMAGLESQEEDAPKRILFFKPMSWNVGTPQKTPGTTEKRFVLSKKKLFKTVRLDRLTPTQQG